jgi:hypothetical protein
MRFRLTYDGELKAAGTNKRTAEKWGIRRHLHPQLAELWQVDAVLNGHAMAYGHKPPETLREAWAARSKPAQSPKDAQREMLRQPINRGGHQCIPLVRSSLSLTCSLDILFLRKESRGSLVFNGGDLDNRIKTLFDGLRMPTEDEGQAQPADADPLYCLLEDDALITDLVIRTDRLLSRSDASQSEVRLIIDVTVNPVEVTAPNSGFLGR